MSSKVVSVEDMEQRRLLRLVESVTGQRLPADKFGVAVIDTQRHIPAHRKT